MLDKLLYQKTSIAPLAMFRVLFGLMMLISIVRFWYNGWIYEQYIYPNFYFTYYGFEWVKPLNSNAIYAVFGMMTVAAAGILLGLFYRTSAVVFFLTFTYVELIDKTNYLNHYYFVSLVSFWMIFVPANRYFSLDVWLRPSIWQKTVPAWTINIFKFQLGVVYCYAGMAKLNYDWMVHALPLKIWLPAKTNIPLIGWLFNYPWSAKIFSWCGALYDLTIPFLLLHRHTRLLAYGAVLVFHLMTAMLFQIGMFPYMMIAFTLVFFPADFHQRIIDFFTFKNKQPRHQPAVRVKKQGQNGRISFFKKTGKYALLGYVVFQLVFPFRYLCYPGNLFWTEEGYRFSWRVMLMEKAGYVVFHVYDPETGKIEQVNNYDYLTPTQEKQMSTQPDMILQFAHFLKKQYQQKGFENPQVRAESYVTLNGRRSQPFINPDVNLIEKKDIWKHKDWILPLESIHPAKER